MDSIITQDLNHTQVGPNTFFFCSPVNHLNGSVQRWVVVVDDLVAISLFPKEQNLVLKFLVLKGMEHQSGLENISKWVCLEHLINLTTHHWTRAPLLLVTSWILLPSNIFVPPSSFFLHIPGHGLAESHNSHSSYVP